MGSEEPIEPFVVKPKEDMQKEDRTKIHEAAIVEKGRTRATRGRDTGLKQQRAR